MVEFNNLTSFEIGEDRLKKTAESVLLAERACETCELSVALVEPGKIRELNSGYRGKDSVTDVLSFECCPDPDVKEEDLEIRPLGEVIICPSRVEEQAKENGNSFEKELNLVLIHGILHLLGYDHEKSEEEAKIMEDKQDGYLRRSLE